MICLRQHHVTAPSDCSVEGVFEKPRIQFTPTDRKLSSLSFFADIQWCRGILSAASGSQRNSMGADFSLIHFIKQAVVFKVRTRIGVLRRVTIISLLFPGPRQTSAHLFFRLIDSRELIIKDLAFDTVSAAEAHAENSCSPVYYLILEYQGFKSIECDHTASHLGKAHGLTNLIRSVEDYFRFDDHVHSLCNL